jgi:3'-phosphoadenosine 5'-phosphosulfate (PAPS) 3'-phosphatase
MRCVRGPAWPSTAAGEPVKSLVMAALEQELQVALDLVRRCGPLALGIQSGGRESLATEDKPDDQGPVTRADLAVEREILATLRGRFPHDAILAEEQVAAGSGTEGDGPDDDWPARARVWMIDPIDGTREFADGDPSWAIHIGLCIDQVPVLGVVHEPARRRTSWAIDFRGERSAWTRSGDEPASALHGLEPASPRWQLVGSKSHRAAWIDPLAAALGIPAEQQFACGSTGVKIGMVGRGEAAIYAHPSIGTKLWDSCAPQVVLACSGGRLTNMLGEPLGYGGPLLGNERGLLATARGVDHAAIVERLRPLAETWFG